MKARIIKAKQANEILMIMLAVLSFIIFFLEDNLLWVIVAFLSLILFRLTEITRRMIK